MMVSSQATQIGGALNFSSIIGKEVALTGGPTFLTATGLDFPAGPNAAVDGATGDFVGEIGKTATFSDFTFGAAQTPVWTLTDGHFSFDLTAGSIKVAGAHYLIVDGVGIAHDLLTGLDDTEGSFTFTTQGSSVKRLKLSWSATDQVDDPAVPDSGPTAILLGAGLLGLGVFASRKSMVR